ncbi:hypothetical protein D3C72_1332490 [compost metagenome]
MIGRRRLAKGVQAQGQVAPGQLMQVVVQQRQEAGEAGLHVQCAPAKVGSDAAVGGQRAQARGGGVAYRAFIQLLQFVHHGVQVTQFVVQAGRGEGRCLVADHHRAATALGLDGLTYVVLDVRVEHRQVAHRQPGIVAGPQATVLAWRPLLRSMGTEVDQRIGLPLRAQVKVGRQVVVAGRRGHIVGGLADLACTWWLRHQQQIAHAQAWQHEHRLPLYAAHCWMIGRVAPLAAQFVAAVGGQGIQPTCVVGHRQGVGQALCQERVQALGMVVAAEQRLQPVNQGFFVGRVHRIARLCKAWQQRFDAARYVQV